MALMPMMFTLYVGIILGASDFIRCADLVGELLELPTSGPGAPPLLPDCDPDSLRFPCMVQRYAWVWKLLLGYTVGCLVLWLFLVIVTSCVVRRTQREYQPISSQEEEFLRLKKNLKEGFVVNEV